MKKNIHTNCITKNTSTNSGSSAINSSYPVILKMASANCPTKPNFSRWYREKFWSPAANILHIVLYYHFVLCVNLSWSGLHWKKWWSYSEKEKCNRYHAVMHDFVPVLSSHNAEQQYNSIRSCLKVGMSEKHHFPSINLKKKTTKSKQTNKFYFISSSITSLTYLLSLFIYFDASIWHGYYRMWNEH